MTTATQAILILEEGQAEECLVTKTIVTKGRDGKEYPIPEGKYIVRTFDGKYRRTNSITSSPIWLIVRDEDKEFIVGTGRVLNYAQDHFDTN